MAQREIGCVSKHRFHGRGSHAYETATFFDINLKSKHEGFGKTLE